MTQLLFFFFFWSFYFFDCIVYTGALLPRGHSDGFSCQAIATSRWRLCSSPSSFQTHFLLFPVKQIERKPAYELRFTGIKALSFNSQGIKRPNAVYFEDFEGFKWFLVVVAETEVSLVDGVQWRFLQEEPLLSYYVIYFLYCDHLATLPR